MKRRLLSVALIFGAVFLMGAIGPKRVCADMVETTDTGDNFPFVYDFNGNNITGGWDHLTLFIELTDADTSITRLDTTCTVSNDGNATDFTPQVCDDTLDGICTQTNSGVWQKPSPGTLNWTTLLNVHGFPDFECTFSVGTGSTAVADVIRVRGRLCTK